MSDVILTTEQLSSPSFESKKGGSTPDWDEYKVKAQRYLDRDVFKGTPLTGEVLMNGAKKAFERKGIFVPAELALSQAQVESSMGRKGRSPRNNPFNVGEFDSGTKKTFKSTRDGVNAYFDLISRDYLSDKNLDQLLTNFTNKRGSRYASNPDYENLISNQVGFIRNFFDQEEPQNQNSVLEQQKKLKDLGFDPGPLDGKEGPRTTNAVKQFQKSQGLKPDGIVGPKTKASLFDELSRLNPFKASEAEASEINDEQDIFTTEELEKEEPTFVNRIQEFFGKQIDDFDQEILTTEKLTAPDKTFRDQFSGFIDDSVKKVKNFIASDQFDKVKRNVADIGKSAAIGPVNLERGIADTVDWIGQNIADARPIGMKKSDILQLEAEIRNNPELDDQQKIAMLTALEGPKNIDKALEDLGDFISLLSERGSDYWENIANKIAATRTPETFQGDFRHNPSFTRAASAIVQAIPSYMFAAGITFATKNPMAGGIVLGLVEGSQSFQEAKEAGKPFEQANVIGGLSATGSIILEALPFFAMFKRSQVLKPKFLKDAIKQKAKAIVVGGAEEGSQEWLQAFWSNLIAKFGYDNTRDLYSGTVEGLIAGAGSGGMLSAFTVGTAQKTDEKIQEAKEQGVTEEELDVVIETAKNEIINNAEKIDEIIRDNVERIVKAESKRIAVEDPIEFPENVKKNEQEKVDVEKSVEKNGEKDEQEKVDVEKSKQVEEKETEEKTVPVLPEEQSLTFKGEFRDAVLAPSTKEKDKWQVTFISKKGEPTGDSVTDTFEKAVNRAKEAIGVDEAVNIKGETIKLSRPFDEPLLKSAKDKTEKLEQLNILKKSFEQEGKQDKVVEVDEEIKKQELTPEETQALKDERAFQAQTKDIELPEKPGINQGIEVFVGRQEGKFIYVAENKKHAKRFGDKIENLRINPKSIFDITKFKEKAISFDALNKFLKSKDINVDFFAVPVVDDSLIGDDDVHKPAWQWIRKYPEIADKIKKSGFDSIKHLETSTGKGRLQVAYLILDNKIILESEKKKSLSLKEESTIPKAEEEITESSVDDLEFLGSGVTPPQKTKKVVNDKINGVVEFSDPEIEKRYKASKGVHEDSLKNRVKSFMDETWRRMTRTFPNLPNIPEYAPIRNILSNQKVVRAISQERTARIIDGITAGMGPNKIDLFTRKIIIDDLFNEAKAGRAVPFGFSEYTNEGLVINIDLLRKEKARIDDLVSNNPDIEEAIEKRKKIWDAVQKDLVKNNILTEEQLKENYFRHQVLEYAQTKATYGTGKKLKKPSSGFTKRRKGAVKDINTDYLQAEFEVLAQSLHDIETAKNIEKIEKSPLNIVNKLKDEAKEKDLDWHKLIPEGFTIWQPKEGNVFFIANSIPQKVANQVMEMVGQDIKIDPNDIKKIMAIGRKLKEFVLPQEVADTLDNLYQNKNPNFIFTAAKSVTTAWKRWVLMNPRRAFKYNYQNFIGDFDAVVAGDVKILNKFNKANGELFDVMVRGKPMTKDMREFFERGGLSTQMTVQELPELRKLEIFQRLLDKKDYFVQKMNLWRRYWQFVGTATVYRESILRYAAYLHYKDLFSKGEKVNYGASVKSEITALKDPLDKAAKVATELLGDYSNITSFGQDMREAVIPFYSWLEINAKRYTRLFRNAFDDGWQKGIRTSATVAAIKGSFFLAKWLIRAAALTTMMTLYNNLFFSDEEDEISEYDKNRVHIILGRDENGQVIVLRGQTAFSDILEWFGLDAAPTYWREYLEGKSSFADIFGKIPFTDFPAFGLNPLQGKIGFHPAAMKFIRGINPLYKLPVETMTGKSLPVFDDRSWRVEDKTRNILRALSLENEYDYLTKKPTRGYIRSLGQAFVSVQDADENAYRYIQGEKYKFLETVKGKGGSGDYYSPRSLVYREYKKALRFKDNRAKMRALAAMKKLGISERDRVKSLRTANPLHGLSRRDKKEFIENYLSKRDRKIYLPRAEKYYRKTFKK